MCEHYAILDKERSRGSKTETSQNPLKSRTERFTPALTLT